MLRIGLVLGGGGPSGAAWQIGVLEGLRRVTGWDPRAATLVVGTACGAYVAGTTTAGTPTWFLHRRLTGESPPDVHIDPDLLTIAEEVGRPRRSGWRIDLSGGLARPVLANPRIAARALWPPWRPPTPKYVLTGLLGEGLLSTDWIGDSVRLTAPAGWGPTRCWIVAVDARTGAREVFGRPGAPAVELADAVQASCAYPGVCRPVSVRRQRFVSGLAADPMHLDLLEEADLDLVLCLDPSGTLEARRHSSPPLHPLRAVHHTEALIRRETARRVRASAAHLERAQNAPVFVLDPGGEELDAMPLWPLGLGDGAEIARRATTAITDLLTRDDRTHTVSRALQTAAAGLGPTRLEQALQPTDGGGEIL